MTGVCSEAFRIEVYFVVNLKREDLEDGRPFRLREDFLVSHDRTSSKSERLKYAYVDARRNVGISILLRRTWRRSKKSKYGMLYIAFSRVKRRSSLKVLLPSENPRHSRNVLWKEVLEHHGSKSECNIYETRVAWSYPDNMEDFLVE
ncbi:ATP-dependent DNA helicase PIF1-like [Vespula squamosa]|uniref:ATP-dependent DNA helicase PIF1-like n=1 Tax=Vespula squamosa TaxID=30214 RepID=A0ABD2A8S4_VESSQ